MGPIGIDLSSRPIALAQRPAERGGPVLTARLGGTDAVAQRAAEAIARTGMRGRTVWLIAGTDATHISPLELPPRTSGAPIAKLAPLEISRLFRLEPGKFELATWDMPGPATATTVLAVALEHARGESLAAEFAAVGLDVAGIEPACSAMASLAAGDGPECLVDLTWGGASLLVVEGARAVIERSWTEGGVQALTEQLRKGLRLEDASSTFVVEEVLAGRAASLPRPIVETIESITAMHAARIAEEILASIEYAERRLAGVFTGGVTLLGTGADLPGLTDRIAGSGVPRLGVWKGGDDGTAASFALAFAAAGRAP